MEQKLKALDVNDFLQVDFTRGSDMKPTKKAACPFCTAKDQKCVPAHCSTFNQKKGVQVECINCGARGPIYGYAADAFAGWKSRDNPLC